MNAADGRGPVDRDVGRDVEWDVLAEYSRTDGRREWVSLGTWLLPGDSVVQANVTELDRLRAENEWRAIDSAPRGEVIRLRMDTGAVVAGYYCYGAAEVGIEPGWVALVPAATGRTCMPVVTPIGWLPLAPNASLSGGHRPSA